MIYVGYPYGWVRCVGKRHQTSVYTVELYAGDDNINIAGDDTEQLTPEGLWTIGTCSCGRINSDRVEEDHHIGRSVTSIISTV